MILSQLINVVLRMCVLGVMGNVGLVTMVTPVIVPSFQHCVVIMVGECVTIVKARAIGRINVLFWSLEISGNFSYLFLPCLVSGQRPVCVDLGSGNDGA